MTLPLPPTALAADAEDDEIAEAPEGRLLTRLHRYRERNRALVKQVKAAALKAHGKLECAACGTDPAERYGDAGASIIECHHTRPVSTLGEGGSDHRSDRASVR